MSMWPGLVSAAKALGALVAILLFVPIGGPAHAQVHTAGTSTQAQQNPGGITPNLVSGGSITLSMTGPTSLAIDITSRLGQAMNPLNSANPITITANYSNVNCTPLFNCLFNPPTLYLYAYVPSTGLTGPGGYSIPASALEASTTGSGWTTFANQTYGSQPAVVPPGPSFLISQKGRAWGSSSATGTLYLNLNLTGVTNLAAGSYTGVMSIRATITQ
mgnify:CR=1 FL=1